MTTVNDLETTQLLIRIAQLQPVVSAYVRSGDLSRALWSSADMEKTVKDLGWRLQRLIDERNAK